MISTRYFHVPKGGVPIVDTMTCMGNFFFGLCALTVLYKRGGMGPDG